jgi:hypothetical protein
MTLTRKRSRVFTYPESPRTVSGSPKLTVEYEYHAGWVGGSPQNSCKTDAWRKSPPYPVMDNHLENYIAEKALDGWEPISHAYVPPNPSSGVGFSVLFRRKK